ncbi:GNAT family N-acetyltransferase [Thalassotalea sp. Y01]|uniref:GNAT family N-acetyltransferase n=1 Tax=Thalassotalea sp. Y01 TaxID=2729613 RepID=UPI00145FBD7F|nr:GNAT family N-acetyltransferase [Thalassotalea sp. Y01]NMP17910.1 GNAT family N-acetyltransferase [Thalassotalea sp. Y01]
MSNSRLASTEIASNKIVSAIKSEKKHIKRFYKTQRYSAGFLGDDVCYLLKDESEQIIASVLVSFAGSTPFLHGLVVASHYQHRGIANRLLQHCRAHHQPLTCFAVTSLKALYQQNGFHQLNTADVDVKLLARYKAYQAKQATLAIYGAS